MKGGTEFIENGGNWLKNSTVYEFLMQKKILRGRNWPGNEGGRELTKNTHKIGTNFS
jgi:hypothetical protein